MTRSTPTLLSVSLAASLLLSGGLRAADDEIRLGAVMPVTGKESKIGGAYKAATELAVKEINDAGGLDVGGKKLKINLALLDDTSDGSTSAQLVEQSMP
jgi:branched-chain amino acid transport system substrate-binding protein